MRDELEAMLRRAGQAGPDAELADALTGVRRLADGPQPKASPDLAAFLASPPPPTIEVPAAAPAVRKSRWKLKGALAATVAAVSQLSLGAQAALAATAIAATLTGVSVATPGPGLLPKPAATVPAVEQERAGHDDGGIDEHATTTDEVESSAEMPVGTLRPSTPASTPDRQASLENSDNVVRPSESASSGRDRERTGDRGRGRGRGGDDERDYRDDEDEDRDDEADDREDEVEDRDDEDEDRDDEPDDRDEDDKDTDDTDDENDD